MKQVRWNDETITVDGNLTAAQIKAGLAQTYPELANYTAREDTNGNITFEKQTGVKG